MAVTVQCTQCQTMLSLDEGFAGGVARCSNCKALVAVPRAADEGVARSARPAAPAGNPDAPRRTERPASDFGGSSASLISPRPLPTGKRTETVKGAVRAAVAVPPVSVAAPPTIPSSVAAAPGRSHARLWVVVGVILLVLVLVGAVLHFVRGL